MSARVTKLFRLAVGARTVGTFTATELREMIAAADKALNPLSDTDAVIIDEVCATFGVTRAVIFGKGRDQRAAWPRQVAQFLLLENRTEEQVGAMFGRHHTSMNYARQKVRDQMDVDPAAAVLVRGCQERIGFFREGRKGRKELKG